LDALASPALGNLRMIETKRSEATTADRQTKLGTSDALVSSVKGEPYWMSVETVCDETVVQTTVAHFAETLRNA
jgi:hypothetical protein